MYVVWNRWRLRGCCRTLCKKHDLFSQNYPGMLENKNFFLYTYNSVTIEKLFQERRPFESFEDSPLRDTPELTYCSDGQIQNFTNIYDKKNWNHSKFFCSMCAVMGPFKTLKCLMDIPDKTLPPCLLPYFMLHSVCCLQPMPILHSVSWRFISLHSKNKWTQKVTGLFCELIATRKICNFDGNFPIPYKPFLKLPTSC